MTQLAVDEPDRRAERSELVSRGHERRVRILAIAIVAIALAPVIATLITRVGRDYVPTGDIGLTDMRVRDVWSLRPPLVGPYSRYGWSHPGPLMFYLLAIPSLLAGQHAWGTLVGGALLQGAAVIWLALLAWRHGRIPLLAAAMVAVSLTYASTGTWVVLEPWNPHIALPFFLLFVFQAWLFSTGEHGVLLGAAFSGSFVVQTHVGYAPLVAVLVLVAAVYAYRDIRGGRVDAAVLRSRVRPSLVLLGVLWLPPLLETAIDRPGNLAQVAYYFVRDKSEPAIGLRSGVQLLSAEFRWPPAWLGGSDFFDPLSHKALSGSLLLLMVPVVLLTATYVVARAHRDCRLQRFVVMTAALTVVAPIVLGNVTGVPYPYLFYWRPQIAILAVLGVVAAFWKWLPSGPSIVWNTIAVIAVVSALAVGSGRIGFNVWTHARAVSPNEAATVSLASQLATRGAPPGGVILRIDTRSLIALQRGIFDELDRRGLRVYADPSLEYEFGENHTRSVDRVDQVWWVAESGSTVVGLSMLPGAQLLAYTSPLSSSQEAAAQQLQRALLAQLRAIGRLDLAPALDSPLLAFSFAGVTGVDVQALGQLAALNGIVAGSGTCRCGVVAFDVSAAPDAPPW